VLIPAPVYIVCQYVLFVLRTVRSEGGEATITTMRRAHPSLMYFPTASMVRLERVSVGVFSSITDCSLPILSRRFLPLPGLPRPLSLSRNGLPCCSCWRYLLCFRPILKVWLMLFRRRNESRSQNVSQRGRVSR
jgi:hypothetical protein